MAMTKIIQLRDHLGEVEGQDLGEVEGDHLGEAEGELLVTMLLLPLLVLLGLAIHCNSEEVSLIYRKFSAHFLDGYICEPIFTILACECGVGGCGGENS